MGIHVQTPDGTVLSWMEIQEIIYYSYLRDANKMLSDFVSDFCRQQFDFIDKMMMSDDEK